MGYEVNPEILSDQLGGLAYVVIETNDDYSFALKEMTNSGNPYGGRIGCITKMGNQRCYESRTLCSNRLNA